MVHFDDLYITILKLIYFELLYCDSCCYWYVRRLYILAPPFWGGCHVQRCTRSQVPVHCTRFFFLDTYNLYMCVCVRFCTNASEFPFPSSFVYFSFLFSFLFFVCFFILATCTKYEWIMIGKPNKTYMHLICSQRE